MSNRNELPGVTAKNFQQRLRETVQTYLGRQGDSLDRGVTVRDLVDSGIVSLPNWWRGGANTLPLTVGEAVTSVVTPELDLTPPPSPTGFRVSAAISNIFIEHDAPLFRAGGGYGSTVVYGVTWVTGDPLPTFDKAVQITEFQGQTFAHATNPSTTWHLWIKWKTKAAVLSSSPAGGTNGLVVRTGEDVALLLEALTGQITESELYADLGSRIDLIDGGAGAVVPTLPKSLVELQADQAAINHGIQTDLTGVGNNLLQTLVTVNDIDQKVTDAGLYVDPGTGEVRIYALEETRTQLNQVSVDLAAAEATLALKASVTYVDNAISTAVLDPSQVPIFGTLEARVTATEIELDGLNATVTTKANSAIVDAQGVRLTQAESDIDGLEGQITQKVNTADYTAQVGGIDARLGVAENTLAAIGDVSSITQIVSQSRLSYRDAERNAEAILRAILRGDKDFRATQVGFATARTDLTASFTAGLQAEAAARTQLSAVVDENAAAIVDEAIARANADSAEATARLALGVQVAGNTAALNSEITTRATETSALASQITALGVTVGSNTAAINTEATTRANADTALSTQITTLGATVAGNTAAISNEATARANGDNANASNISQVQARLDSGDYAAVKVESAASASSITGIQAKYTVKIDNNGYVTGYGLMSEANNGATVSSFAVRADQFYIASPSGPGVSPTVPFIVRTTPTTINGVEVPVGVYLTDGYIQNGTITTAKIANLAVDDAKVANLSVSKLLAGSISAGQYIQSSNYSPGVSGFRLNADGSAEMQNVTARGTVYAASGAIGGVVLDNNHIRAGKAANALGSGFWLGANGNAYFGNSSGQRMEYVDGRLIVRDGQANESWFDFGASGASTILKVRDKLLINSDGSAYFAGTLSAANGTFSGSLTASAINAVNTINIAGNAVTVPVGSAANGSIPSHNIYMNEAGPIFLTITANVIALSGGPSTTVDLDTYVDGAQRTRASISLSGGFSGSVTASCKVDVGAGWHSVGGAWFYSGTPMALGQVSVFAIGVQR